MNLLSFDAVTRYASVAISRDGMLAGEYTWLAGRDHASQLPEAVRLGMTRSELAFSDLDAVIVGTGPGSYTGIRIGIALAKGICTAHDTRLIGVSSLEQLAYACGAWNGPICAAIPAGAGVLGTALFSGPWTSWRRLTADAAAASKTIEPSPEGTLLCGPGKRQLLDTAAETLAPDDFDVPRASVLLRLAVERGLLESPDLVISPNYLRLSTPEERLAAAT